MITSIKLKIFLQYTVFLALSAINKVIPHNKRKILIYVNLDFRDNVKAMFDYLVENGYNNKYCITCVCADYEKYLNVGIPNVKFVSKPRGVLYFLSAAYVFYCNGKYPILPGRNQQVIQMWHGAPFKAPDEGMRKLHTRWFRYYTTVLSTSKFLIPTWSHHFSFPAEKIFVGGYPRCDLLFMGNPNYDFGSYKKIILWAPTFRKSKMLGYDDTESNEIIPLIKSTEFQQINEVLKGMGCKVVVKLHPSQDLDNYNLVNMDHFILLSQQDFASKGMDLYRFMAQCDAMITDYSSIFVDYLLLDRPLGFTIDDEDEYLANRGFSLENPDSYRAGMKIKNMDEFIKFCKEVVDGVDQFKDERERVNGLLNDCRGGHYSENLLKYVGIYGNSQQ